MQDNFAKWLFRIVAAVGAIGFIVAYSVRHDWSKGAMPSFSDDYRPPASAEPVANSPASVAPAPSVVVAEPVDGQAYVPCQPIGRTTIGELVYSMDCQRLPAR